MTYKGMLLSALLVPVTVTSYGKELVDSRIQQLKEARYQKELELSELGIQIDKKEELIGDLFFEEVHFVKKHYKSLDLSSEEKNALKCQIGDLNKEFELLMNGSVVEVRVKGLFEELITGGKESSEGFEKLKFWAIRSIVEQKLLKVLTRRYEECLLELIAIGKELEKFDKLVS